MNDFILNCIIISLAISTSNIISQYIIEVYIRRPTFVTLVEYNEKMKSIDEKFITVGLCERFPLS
jgi:hypothetical protein